MSSASIMPGVAAPPGARAVLVSATTTPGTRTGQETPPGAPCTGPISLYVWESTGKIMDAAAEQPWDRPNIRFPGQYYDKETERWDPDRDGPGLGGYAEGTAPHRPLPRVVPGDGS